MQCTTSTAATLAALATVWAFAVGAAEVRGAAAGGAVEPARGASAVPAAAPADADASAAGVPSAAEAPAVSSAAGAAAVPSAAEAVASLPAWAREWSFALGDARELAFETTAGTVRVVAGDGTHVRVRGGYRDADRRGEMPKVDYVVKRGVGRLEVRGRDELEIVVEVPPRIALGVSMSAGELVIGARDGDLDVRLRAGRVRIDAADAPQYADIDVSVLTGEIDWPAANTRRGGLFRSFERRGTGSAKLHVRVYAGSVEIV